MKQVITKLLAVQMKGVTSFLHLPSFTGQCTDSAVQHWDFNVLLLGLDLSPALVSHLVVLNDVHGVAPSKMTDQKCILLLFMNIY